MMSSRIIRPRQKHSWLFRKTEPFFRNLITGYNHSLARFVRKPWIALIIMGIAALIIFLIGRNLPTELAPLEDKSRLRILSTAPEGTSFEKMDEYIEKMVDLVDTLKERESILSVTSPGFGSSVSVNSGFVRITLVPPTQREKSQQELAAELTPVVSRMNFARSFIVQEQTIGAGRGSALPVQYVIQAPNFESLKKVIPELLERVNNNEVFNIVDVDLKFSKPELRVEIDRDKAREMGISVSDIAQTIQLYFGGQRYGYFILNGKQYQVIGQATRQNNTQTI